MNELPFCVVLEKGEALFSVVPRCTARYGKIGQEIVLRRLTGQRRLKPLLGAVPSYIPEIALSVPRGSPLGDPLATIREHTGLPYFTFFIAPTLREAMTRMLVTGKSAHIVFLKLGLTVFRCSTAPIHPHWCVQCNIENRSKFGVAFYRREHQLPGVCTCFIHGTMLSNGCEICGRNPVDRLGLRMPGVCRCGETNRPLNVLDEFPGTLEVHNWLARESAYLLTAEAPKQLMNASRLSELYVERGFGSGRLDSVALAAGIEKRYGSDFLDWLGYPAWSDGRPSRWIRDFLVPSKSKRLRATIEYLLFIGTVADSARKFYEEVSEFRLTAAVPVKVADWRVGLAELLRASEFKMTKAAALIGQNPYSVAAEARKQGLHVPLSSTLRASIGETTLAKVRSDLAAGVSKLQIQIRHNISDWALLRIELDEPSLIDTASAAKQEAKLNFHREQVLQFISANEVPSRQELQIEKPGTYEFMLVNDRIWFGEHLPRMKAKPRRPVDEERLRKRDAEIADKIATSYESLENSSGRPARITKTKLLRFVGVLSTFHNHRDQFSRTTAILERLAETKRQHLRRVIVWAITKMAKFGIAISINSLRRCSSTQPEKLRAERTFVCETAERVGATVSPNSFFDMSASRKPRKLLQSQQHAHELSFSASSAMR